MVKRTNANSNGQSVRKPKADFPDDGERDEGFVEEDDDVIAREQDDMDDQDDDAEFDGDDDEGGDEFEDEDQPVPAPGPTADAGSDDDDDDDEQEEDLPDLPAPYSNEPVDEYAEPLMVAGLLVNRDLLEAALDKKAPGPLAAIPAVGCEHGEDNPLDMLDFGSQALIAAAMDGLAAGDELPSPAAIRRRVQARAMHAGELDDQELADALETTRLAEEWADRLVDEEGRLWLREAIAAHARHAVQALISRKTVETEVRLEAAKARHEAIKTWAGAAGGGGGNDGMTLEWFDEVEMERVRWLFPDVIPDRNLTVIAGKPGTNKSTLTCDIAARITTGSGWPVGGDADGRESEFGQETRAPGGVIMLSAEDNSANTIVPRIHVQGGDRRYVVRIKSVKRRDEKTGKVIEGEFDLSQDIQRLERLIDRFPAQRGVPCRLVVVDPVGAYLGKADSHNDASVRSVLAPLAALAERKQVAVICVSHENKSNQGDAQARVMGSTAFVGAPRAVWGIVVDPDDEDRRLMLGIKNNLAKNTVGFAYRVGVDNEWKVTELDWESQTIPLSMNGWLSESGGMSEQRREAKEFLQSLLANGPVKAKDVMAAAKEAGLSMSTVNAAKKAAGADSFKRDFGSGWIWRLSGDERELPQDATSRHLLASEAETAAEEAAGTEGEDDG